jgi:anti-anti-sigma factor
MKEVLDMDDFESSLVGLTVTVQHLDGYAELILTGELDIATAPVLHECLDQLVLDGQRDLRLNVSALWFLDAGGIGFLLELRQQLGELGGTLTMSGVNGAPLRVLTICNLLDVITGDTAPEPPQTGRMRD